MSHGLRDTPRPCAVSVALVNVRDVSKLQRTSGAPPMRNTTQQKGALKRWPDAMLENYATEQLEENEMAAAPASPAPEAAAQAPAAAANLEVLDSTRTVAICPLQDLFGAETQPARQAKIRGQALLLSLAREEALQRHDKAVVEPGDMRLAAVRNLPCP